MLEKDRYNQALVALSQNAENFDHEQAFARLLEEQYRTQIALNKLGVNHTTPVKEIKKINEVVLLQNQLEEVQEKDQEVLIYIIGAPKTLKSTLGRSLSKIGGLRINEQEISLSVQEETAGYAKDALKRKSSNPNAFDHYSGIAYTQLILDAANEAISRKLLQSSPRIHLVIRGPFDTIPFQRANFLDGKINHRTLDDHLNNVQKTMESQRNQRTGIIHLSCSPQESLRRNEEAGNDDGKVMNPNSLRILHEQYLRFHQEMIESGRVPHLNLRVPYACVDMSGEDITKPIDNFLSCFTQMASHFFPLKA
jgi:hypothetical protein